MPKLRLFIVSIWAEHALSACGVLAIRANCVVPEQTMTEYPYILFNKSPEQMRILGARGGKALRSQPASPPGAPCRHPASGAPTRPAAGNRRQSHSLSGQAISLAAGRGKATGRKQAGDLRPHELRTCGTGPCGPAVASRRTLRPRRFG